MAQAIALICLVSAAATAAEDPRPARVLVMDLGSSIEDAEIKQQVVMLQSRIAQRMNEKPELDVTTAEDVRHLLELEVERQAAGCDEENSCMAEIAGALGARFAVVGKLSKLGAGWILQLSLLDAVNARTLARQFVERDALSAVIDDLEPAVDALADVAAQAVRADWYGEPESFLPSASTMKTIGAWSALLGLSGLALSGAGVGGGMWIAANNDDFPANTRATAQLAAAASIAVGAVSTLPIALGLLLVTAGFVDDGLT